MLIEKGFDSLYRYIQQEGYKGWDLFDGLNSTIFRTSPFYRSKLFRLAWIQFFKRSPINCRKMALVPKDFNPKGLALFASGLVTIDHLDQAKTLLGHLEKLACSGYSGICWGYNFDWESRAFYAPVGTPNIVSTVFVANAFLDHFDKTGNTKSMRIAQSACDFLLKDLVLFEDRDTLCFAYIPGEKARVHNAYMLGAALLARVFSHTRDSDYYEKSKKAMTYSIKALRPDYSWPYGERHHHQFVDNFHTGFNLVALKEWIAFTDDHIWEEHLKKAYEYFLDNFWLEDGRPKYYNTSLYPIDIHCSAQGIMTCLKLSGYHEQSIVMVEKIAKWAVENMQDKSGYFYYQKSRWYTNHVPYMRWSQAWMFYALANLLAYQKNMNDKNKSNRTENAPNENLA